MTAAILYARYSTAMQSAASVEDQFRLLRIRAEREGWEVLAEHADRAISGTVRDRPGLAACMAAIEQGKAQVVLAESLDRLSRDQEDLANLFKRVRFKGARIITLSEGEVGALHIGMGSTMSAIMLEQLGEKVRRGQRGVVEDGRIPGGLSYGYRKVRQFGSDGEPVRGLREIDQDQAAIVRRIFEAFVNGHSPLTIARHLNAEGIPAPRGGLWRASTITGHRQRRNGILHNELYRGRVLYNRQTFRKDPDTRKRVSRVNSPGELVAHDVLELRIVDDALWDQVASKLELLGGGRPDQARRPKRLLSGLLKCAHCGGNYTVIAKDYWGCSNRRQTGTCQNHALIRDGEAQERIWTAVRTELLHPDVIAAYVDEMRKAAADWRRSQISRRVDEERRLKAIKDEQAKLVEAIIAGVDPSLLRQRSLDLRAEYDAIEAARIDIDKIEHLLSHPALSKSYRRRCEDLSALAATGAQDVARARPLITSLVNRIDVTPRADGTKGADLIVHGQLAALLSIPQNATSPDTGDGVEASSLKLVAGVGFEPTTFRL